MDERLSRNGHTPVPDEHEPSNVYADAVRGERPREIVEFELSTDPYANMLPRVHTRTGVLDPDDEWDQPRGKSPLIVAISILLIAVLVLPIVVAVFVRLGF